MARASSVDPCLLCGQLPCECNKARAKPKARPRKAAPSPERAIDTGQPPAAETPLPIEPRQSMMDRMRARAAQPIVVPEALPEFRRARPTAASAELPALDEQDNATLAALRVFDNAFQIEGKEVDRFRPYLDKPETRQERSAAWKSRRPNNEIPKRGTETAD